MIQTPDDPDIHTRLELNQLGLLSSFPVQPIHHTSAGPLEYLATSVILEILAFEMDFGAGRMGGKLALPNAP